MKRRLFYFLLCTFSFYSYSSGTYKRSNFVKKPTPRIEYSKSENSFKSMVYGLLESNITVNNISVTENRFTIRGSFSKKTSFDNLLEKLKGRDVIDREISLAP